MNAEIERQLMTTVERVVRPVMTWDRRKFEIRAELLTHLKTIYEQELERTGDEQTALEEARSRFGSTEELTQELQRGVRRIPRWIVAVNKFMQIDVTASAQRNALRLTSAWFAELFVLFALCEAAVMWKGVSPWPMLVFLLLPLVMMTLIAYVALEGAFAGILVAECGAAYWRCVAKTCWKLGGLGLLYKLMQSLLMMNQWGWFDGGETGFALLSAVMLPAVFLLVMWGARPEFERNVKWARLDLSEG